MKKLLYVLTLLLIAATAKSQLSNGLVSYWNFNETSGNAIDAIGNNPCTVSGATRVTTGKLGNCFSFDGDNDYLEAANSTSLNLTGSVSISAWIQINDNTFNLWILGKPASSSSHDSPYKSYGIHVDYDNGIMTPGIVVTTNGSYNGVNTNENISTNQWYHIVGVYDGSYMKIYQNGTFKNQLSWTGNLTTFSTPLRIGVNGGYAEDFSGLIDEVGIWNRALSASEVSQLYNDGSGLNPIPGPNYTLAATASPSAGGSITLSPSGGNYASGTNVTATASANTGYTFSGWSGALTGTTNPGTIAMNTDKTLTATFTPTMSGSGVWQTNGSNIYYNGGNVGIGQSQPTNLLHLLAAPNASTYITLDRSSNNLEGGLRFATANATDFYLWNDNTGNLQISAFGIDGEDDEHPRLRIPKANKNLLMGLSGGNVGIGTNNPSSTLTVNGKILAKEVEVVSSITSDYVFESAYQLMPLTDLEIYLKQHKHLPGIPSTLDFKKQGQNLGEMQDMLLRKIEELTLYIISQEKAIKELNVEINSLKAKED